MNKKDYHKKGIEAFLSGVHYVTQPKENESLTWQRKAFFVGYNAAKKVAEKSGLHQNTWESLCKLSSNLSRNCLKEHSVYTKDIIEEIYDLSLFIIDKKSDSEILFN